MEYKSAKSLMLVALCLFLSLLSKESGVLFVAMSLLYLVWRDRKRLLPFIGVMVLPVALWLVLKIHAVGLLAKSNVAPIESIDLIGRLLTIPSIIWFYVSRLFLPIKLATGYYWVHPTYSIQNVLLPLILDLLILGAIIFIAFLIKKRGSKDQLAAYLIFTTWAVLGLIIHLQLIPLDFTACEPWFYFSMAGVLGMVGVTISTLAPSLQVNQRLLSRVAVALIILLGVRTAARGTDWGNPYALAMQDISASKENYNAYNNVATSLMTQGRYKEAEPYAEQSIKLHSYYTNNFNLGLILSRLGNYPGAAKAYNNSLKYGDYISAIHGLGELTLVSGSPDANQRYLTNALKLYPQDPLLWSYLAVVYQQNHDNANAKIAIANARQYGSAPRTVYEGIMNNRPFEIPFPDLGTAVTVQPVVPPSLREMP
jgi:tetratricopeptide (TPR) repeat protein